MSAPSATTDSRPRVVSLFSGCGGSSLGYHLASCNVLLAVEWDDNAAACYKANFPDTDLFHGDIHELTVDEIMKRAGIKEGELDILDGSPPCQGFSTAGKRMMDDPRNSLYKEYIRILKGLRPRAFVMENVRGLVMGRMKKVFLEILRDLKGCGYDVKARVVNAANYGVPQARQRIIFIGIRSDLGRVPTFPRQSDRRIKSMEALSGLPEDARATLAGVKLERWSRTQPGASFSACDDDNYLFNSQKLDPLRPSPTITKTVNLYHWAYPRELSIAEIKRLHGFPDSFALEGPFSEQWARIGNSVPPPLMRAIAEAVLATMGEKDDS